MGMSLGINRGMALNNTGGGGFNPRSLFANGEEGLILDPSNRATLFEDSAGSTLVSAGGSEVGRITDLSGNGHDLVQATPGALPIFASSGRASLVYDDAFAMQTNDAVDLTGTSVITVVARIRTFRRATAAIVIEASENSFSTTNSFYISSPNANNAQDFGFNWTGNVANGSSYSTGTGVYPIFGANVICATYDLTKATQAEQFTALIDNVAPTLTVRIAGTETGAFGNHVINFGARNAASLFLEGAIGRVIIIGRALTASEKAAAATWCGVSGNDRVAFLGDSTIDDFTGGMAVPKLADICATVIANAGDTIAQQQAAWTAVTDKTIFDAIAIQVGLNDLAPGESAATALGRLQTLVDTVAADAPGKPIMIGQMIPCRSRLVDVYGGTNGPIAYQKWLEMNDAIAGNGASAITGVDVRVTEHVALMNDGSGNLLSAYDTGDGIHPNNLGRDVNARAWRNAAASVGLSV
jgi:lysophospholipase L1-like esterase